MKRAWLDLPIREKRQWFDNEIDSLTDYLAGKEPFTPNELAEADGLLRRIRDRAAVDRSYYQEHRDDLTGEHLAYYRAISDLYEKLPERDTEPQQWFEALGNANLRILVN